MSLVKKFKKNSFVWFSTFATQFLVCCICIVYIDIDIKCFVEAMGNYYLYLFISHSVRLRCRISRILTILYKYQQL